jgi:hypothetical protein
MRQSNNEEGINLHQRGHKILACKNLSNKHRNIMGCGQQNLTNQEILHGSNSSCLAVFSPQNYFFPAKVSYETQVPPLNINKYGIPAYQPI